MPKILFCDKCGRIGEDVVFEDIDNNIILCGYHWDLYYLEEAQKERNKYLDLRKIAYSKELEKLEKEIEELKAQILEWESTHGK
jgi:hypothetical protein